MQFKTIHLKKCSSKLFALVSYVSLHRSFVLYIQSCWEQNLILSITNVYWLLYCSSNLQYACAENTFMDVQGIKLQYGLWRLGYTCPIAGLEKNILEHCNSLFSWKSVYVISFLEIKISLYIFNAMTTMQRITNYLNVKSGSFCKSCLQISSSTTEGKSMERDTQRC